MLLNETLAAVMKATEISALDYVEDLDDISSPVSDWLICLEDRKIGRQTVCKLDFWKAISENLCFSNKKQITIKGLSHDWFKVFGSCPSLLLLKSPWWWEQNNREGKPLFWICWYKFKSLSVNKNHWSERVCVLVESDWQ